MKLKNKKFIEFLNMGIFPGYVLFAHGMDYEELVSTIQTQYKKKAWKDDYPYWELGLRDDKKLVESADYFVMKRELENPKLGINKTLIYLLIKSQFKFTDYEMCKLSHEVVHICQFYLPDVLDRNKEIEAEAYLHSHLMEQTLKHLRA